ncbi:tetratricopeptide repeat-containing diguanylate cyclase [Shewanella donghaensis]|uniref:tetratricopeptide repeat-containing diguanylate cyclase n=1 Tax=Shewanella donghaensis TaxID=238836 RepID=UPI001182C783|nr:tetratricopeptide repeat-containing diguanylate cyclase [Shewanella donghaensis]
MIKTLLKCTLALGIFTAILINTTKADVLTNQQRIDQLFEIFNLGEEGDLEKLNKYLTELDSLIVETDTAQQEKLIPLKCWYHPSDTTEEFKQAITNAEELMQQHQKSYPSQLHADLLLCRASHYQYSGKPKQAKLDYDAAIKEAYQIENIRLIADGRSMRGAMLSYEGDYTAALEDLIPAQSMYEQLNLDYWARVNLSEIANSYRRFGDPQMALSYQQKLEKAYLDNDQKFEAIEMNSQIAYSYEELGKNQQSLARFQKSYQFWLDENDPISTAGAAVDIAGVLLKLGEIDEAIQTLDEAEKIITIEFDGLFSFMKLFRAQAALIKEQPEKALRYSQEAEQGFLVSHNERGLTQVLTLRNEIYLFLEDFKSAHQALTDYLKMHHQLDQKSLSNRNSEMRARFNTDEIESENKTLQEIQRIKELELQVLEKNKELQQVIIILVAIILFIVTIFAFKQLKRKQIFKLLALTDELTQLANRRHTYNLAKSYIKQANNDKSAFSLISFDADHFKKVNDTLGHDIGDKVLVKLSKVASDLMRKSDTVGRVGGEEFLVLLPGANEQQAEEIATRLVNKIADANWESISSGLKQTVSAGVSTLKDDKDLEALLLRVDNALYQAKSAGRNCVKTV